MGPAPEREALLESIVRRADPTQEPELAAVSAVEALRLELKLDAEHAAPVAGRQPAVARPRR